MRARLLSTRLAVFARDTRGIAATEFILVVPLLLLILIGSFTIFDWLRASYVTQRATFTVGDLVSRQTERDDDVLDQVKETFFRLAVNDVGQPQLRITSILQTEDGFEVDWTYNSGSGSLASALYDSVIVTQTMVRIVPTFGLLFDRLDWTPAEDGYEIELAYTASTRPRFVTRIAEKQ